MLQVLLPELERSASEDGQSNGVVPNSGSTKITAVTRRVLPALRLYSSWLLTNAEILAAQGGDNVLNVQVRELWKIYATALTLIISTFGVPQLPDVDYLLDEDENTMGFKPLDNETTKRNYYAGADFSVQKPKYHDRGIQRHHPNVEMLGRIRDLLTDGMFQHSNEVGSSHCMSDYEAHWKTESPNQACGCRWQLGIHLRRRRYAGGGELPNVFVNNGYRARRSHSC